MCKAPLRDDALSGEEERQKLQKALEAPSRVGPFNAAEVLAPPLQMRSSCHLDMTRCPVGGPSSGM